MFKKVIYLNILMTLVLSACSGAVTTEPQKTPTPINSTAPAVSTITPIATLQFPTVTPTITLYPTNAPDCTNHATFVADVTVPDNTNFNPGANYTKTWRVNNSGTCAWTAEYSMAFASGFKSDAPEFVPLAYTAPGGTLDISVDLTAPSQKGTANTFFELHTPDGKRFQIDTGVYLYVSIYVTGSAAPTNSAFATIQPPGPTSTSVPGSACVYTADPVKVADTISAINSYRAQNGLPALSVNPLLTLAAEAHSADMACNQLFGHIGTDNSTPITRVAATGYAPSALSENVYGSYPPLSGQGVVAWWATDQLDPRHNENLISTKYTEIGVSYSFYNNYGYYVIDFASP
jgi:uncharacterized protein YkwD